MGALAILGDDTTGTAEQVLGLTIPNAMVNCAQGVSSDGTWSETPNYWYFGVTGHAEMISSLLTLAMAGQLTAQAHPLMAAPSVSVLPWQLAL